MKITISLRSLRSTILFPLAVAIISAANAEAQLLEYTFNTPGPTQTNTGSLGGSLSTKAFGGDDANYVGGTGVSGFPGDYALDLTSAQSNGNGPYAAGSGALGAMTSMTISGWARNGVSPSGYDARIFTNRTGANGFELTLAGTQFTLNIGGTNITGGGFYNFTSSDWKFWAVTFDGATGAVNFYFGGTTGTLTLFSTTTSVTTINASTTNYVLGNISAGSRAFDGQIDNFRLYDTTLSGEELIALRNAALIPEPSLGALFGVGLFGLIYGVRRRKGN